LGGGVKLGIPESRKIAGTKFALALGEAVNPSVSD
jgi:hypothetical protein